MLVYLFLILSLCFVVRDYSVECLFAIVYATEKIIEERVIINVAMFSVSHS